MELKISHQTHYRYSAPVSYALQKLRLRPLPNVLQTVPDWSIDIDGGQIEASYKDHYGNHVDLVSVTPGATEVSVRASGTVVTEPGTGVLGKVYGRAPLWHFLEPTGPTTPGDTVRDLARTVSDSDDTLDGLHSLSAEVLKAVPYTLGVTNSQTTAEEALKTGGGVCQDHAQIFAAAARVAGVPARYVSGYLMMNDRIDQDASHAWVEAYLDTLGWVGFDVSNGYSPDERYVRIATGRDARDASPIEGIRVGAADETLVVSLQVQQ
ncbi:transglutaminase family protein [Sulfitobacter sp. HNIBRBA3233]|uniref:transglutaminase family protein n=1 Tax=Sulfitobacter marinivivus TaxID=3158558 RepID=UPI0032DF3BE0